MANLVFIKPLQDKKKRIKKRWRLLCFLLAAALIVENILLFF
jgi:hypothetical protein